MDNNIGTCIHCGQKYERNLRVKEQQYCAAAACQRARRTRWQRQKLKTDEAYRENQMRCQKEWQKQNAGYYREYRAAHPEYEERNRALQLLRDNRRKDRDTGDRTVEILAKMDSFLGPYCRRNGSRFKLFVERVGDLAKMDVLTVRLVPIRGSMWV